MTERDDRFWAKFLGIEPADWQAPGVSVREQVGLSGYSGIWSFQRDQRVVVSAPAAWFTRLEDLVGGSDARRLLEPEWWRSVLGDVVERVIGPAYQGGLEPAHFTPQTDAAVELLSEGAAKAALNELEVAVGAEAWDSSALGEVKSPIAVRRDAGRVVALCGYRPRGDDAGDPCVLVHPEFYGRGYGTAVVSAVVASALRDDKLLLYQTLESNLGAVAIAKRLGYRQYARYLAIRLR